VNKSCGYWGGAGFPLLPDYKPSRGRWWIRGCYFGATECYGLLRGAMGLFWLLTNNANVGALWTSGADSQQNYRNRFISGLKDVLLPS